MTDGGDVYEVERYLGTIYSNTSQEEKKKAMNYLELFQKSKEAWEITHHILCEPKFSVQLKLFSAQTFRSKIVYDLYQISPDNLPQLKDSTIELVKVYPNYSDRIIRTQLCVALTQLALQYREWKQAFVEIIGLLTVDENLVFCVLDFLRVLPEELSEVRYASLTDEEFEHKGQELVSNNVEQVLLILNNIANSQQRKRLAPSILSCLNGWIREIPIEKLLQIDSLVSLIFECLHSADTFDQGVECMCTIIAETRDSDNYELIDILYQDLLKINGNITGNQELLQQPDIFSDYTRLFVEAGEAWHVLIVNHAKHFKALVKILLECCKYDEDLDVVRYTFNFWYLLKLLLTLPKFTEAKAELQGIFSDLIKIILKNLTYPTDSDNDKDLFHGDFEQEDKFKEFRYEMGDVLKDCCAIVGAEEALTIPFQQVESVLSSDDPSKMKWQYVEAPLFSMRTMAREVSLNENNILPMIMKLLVQLPEHPKVRYSATLVLGRYTEWTSKHPGYLEPQLNYIIQSFQVGSRDHERDVIASASHALMYFCQDCSKLLVNNIEQLYLLYEQIRGQLDVQSIYEVTDGIAHVIKEMPLENIYQTCDTFWKPTLTLLYEIVLADQSDDQIFALIADQVEILTIYITLLRCHDYSLSEYPVANLFIEKVWPLLTSILQRYGNSLKVSERTLKTLKAAIQSFGLYLGPKLSEIASILHEGFHATSFGCYLWVSGAMIREFGDEYSSDETKASIFEFGLSQCQMFFELVSNFEDIKQIPDVIEDFFRMASDILMFYPFDFIPNHSCLQSILHISLRTIKTISQFEPLIACLHFLIDYVSWGFPQPPISFFNENPPYIQKSVQQFLLSNDNASNLINAVLGGVVFTFHNDLQPDANDLLIKVPSVLPDVSLGVSLLLTAASSLPNVQQSELNVLLSKITLALPVNDMRTVRAALQDFTSWYLRKNVSSRSEF